MPIAIKLLPREDFYFSVTAWELESLRHLHRVVEDNLADLLQRYDIVEDPTHRPEFGPPRDLQLIMIEARIPAMFRNPLLISAWTLYESCLVETSDFFRVKLQLPYSLAAGQPLVPDELRRWKRWDVLNRGSHFFTTQLDMEPFANASDRAALNDLRRLRNVLTHTGGRRGPAKPDEWEYIARNASRFPGLDMDTGYVVPSAEFVGVQFDLVDRSAKHLVAQARAIVAGRRLYD